MGNYIGFDAELSADNRHQSENLINTSPGKTRGKNTAMQRTRSIAYPCADPGSNQDTGRKKLLAKHANA